MSYINSILLGVIQGLTEFLPVSSSAHLNLAQRILNINEGALTIDVALHFGTLCAVLVYFYRDIIALAKNYLMLKKIIIACALTGLIGLLMKDTVERIFTSLVLIGAALLINGIILLAVSYKTKKNQKNDITCLDAAVFGFMQSVALIPGISRSGITISTLLFRGVDRKTAFDFSFISAVPLIFGIFLLSLKDISVLSNVPQLVTGILAAFFTGLAALHILKMIVIKARLHIFGYYCCFISLLIWLKMFMHK